MSRSQQSPINLTDPIHAELGDRALEIHWSESIRGSVVKDEHGVKVEFEPNPSNFIRLDRKAFHLVAFHFHCPSEHWVEGKHFPMELHVIHRQVEGGELAVLGILIDYATNSADPCPSLMSEMQSVLQTPIEDRPLIRISTNPRDFLPDSQDEYFRYEGSLTTAPYDETVSWVVFQTPLKLKKADLDALVKEFEAPARFPEPINRRFVLSTFRPGGEEPKPASTKAKRKPTKR